MKIAMPVEGNKVSSTFHKADKIMIVEIIEKEILSKSKLDVQTFDLKERIDTLIHQNVDIFICYSIDSKSNSELSNHGINILPHILGEIENVIERYQENNLYFIHC